MPYQKSFDELLDGILTDYRNQSPPPDTSRGSMIFIKSACLASALWGLYHYQHWLSRQPFPDTADPENLEHHAWVRDIKRTYGEADAALLARILDDIRRPPAGGNRYDYVKWALEVDNVARAWCYPLAQGLGTVDVVIMANAATTGDEIPSSSARIGTATSVTAGKLIDSGAAFTSDHAVAVGDIVENPLRETRSAVTDVDSDTELSLADDLFKFANEPYIVHGQTGTNTAVSAGKLVDDAGAFTEAVCTVKPGDIVENVSENLETTVTAVDSGTELSLAADIFTATGKTYVVRGLVAEVKKHIDQRRPVTASRVGIVAPTIAIQDVVMSAVGAHLDRAAVAADIASYMLGMIPDQPLFLAKLSQIAMDKGADDVTSITTPATNIIPDPYHVIRPGVIDVS